MFRALIIFTLFFSYGSFAKSSDLEHKFRVSISSPPGTTLSGFNRVFFLSCKDGKISETYSGHEPIKYLKSEDSITGEKSYSEYTRGIDVTVELMECDKPLVFQNVRFKIKGHYLKKINQKLMRPAPAGSPSHHQDYSKPKSLTRYSPKIKRVTYKEKLKIDTTGTPVQIVTLADTPFTLSVKRF